MSAPGLRLMVYDDTCRGRGPLPGLTHTWKAGALLYRRLGRLERWRGVRGWAEALEWLAELEPGRPISEIQYWGHGRWGSARVGNEILDARALSPGHPLYPRLLAVRERLGPDALVWLRTCESFGAWPGQAFARALSDFFGCRVAGHTYIIGPWQSGLHSLRPGEAPAWPVTEGLREGTPEAPLRARWSRPGEPHTLTCFHGAVPPGW